MQLYQFLISYIEFERISKVYKENLNMWNISAATIFITLIIIGSVIPQDPSDMCMDQGDTVCNTCNTYVACSAAGLIDEDTSIVCTNGTLCDNNGIEVRGCQTESVACFCTDDNNDGNICKADPNNERAFVICGDNADVILCAANELPNLDTCLCESSSSLPTVCAPCDYVADDDPNDCKGFLYCGDGSFSYGKCVGTYCFNGTSCKCDILQT